MAEIEQEIYDKDSLLVTDKEIYQIKIYHEDIQNFEMGVAYLSGEYFLPYRGECDIKELIKNDHIEPGIYTEKKSYDGQSEINDTYLQFPSTDEEREQYKYEGKISSIDPNKIIEMVNNHEQILIPASDSSKTFLPTVNVNDDILKRLIKKVLIQKQIDIDNYRTRFVDKNALFNFKQVIKGDNKLSILLFDRGCDALNLKYTIIVEEADPNVTIGERLDGPIKASSEDTYEI